MRTKPLTACATGLAFALITATGAAAQGCTEDEETGEIECPENDGTITATAHGSHADTSNDGEVVASGAVADDEETGDEEDSDDER